MKTASKTSPAKKSAPVQQQRPSESASYLRCQKAKPMEFWIYDQKETERNEAADRKDESLDMKVAVSATLGQNQLDTGQKADARKQPWSDMWALDDDNYRPSAGNQAKTETSVQCHVTSSSNIHASTATTDIAIHLNPGSSMLSNACFQTVKTPRGAVQVLLTACTRS